MEIRNAQYNQFGTIDCEINHPVHGWIPFTSDQSDIEPLGAAVYAAVLSGEGGEIAPYIAPVKTLDEMKGEKIAELSVEYQQRIQSFPWDFGAPHGVQHLQLRDVTDQANWLTLQGKAQMLIAAGQGDAEVLAIRTEENITVPVTANVAAQVMDALSTFGGAMLAHKWAIKDAINAVSDHAELDAIDITAGWPE